MPETLSRPVEQPESEFGEIGVLIELLVEINEDANRSDSLQYRVASWNLLMKILVRLENLLDFSSSRIIRWHEGMIRAALAIGEFLFAESNTVGGFTRKSHGMAHSDIEAHMKWLRDKQVMWHTEMTPQRRSNILANVFGIQDSTA